MSIKRRITFYVEKNNTIITLILALLGLSIAFASYFFPINKEQAVPGVPAPVTVSTVEDNVERAGTLVWYSIAGVLIVFAAILWIKFRFRKSNQLAVFNEESRFFQSIKEIMVEELLKNEIVIASIRFTDITTISDIKAICTRVFYPKRNHLLVEKNISDARMKAYSIKYSAPNNEDEKIIGKTQFGDWETEFVNVLHEINIKDVHSLHVLDVGIGNANTYSHFFNGINNFTGVDISATALAAAKKKLNRLVLINNEAEALLDIENSTMDVYLSFRTYQSTLFDARRALHEARRVLKPGGCIIISIPTLYYAGGKFIKGLSDLNKNITIEHAYVLVNRIKAYMEMLGFNRVIVNEKSPYEIFIAAKLEG